METYFIARLIRGPSSVFGRSGRRWGGLLAALFVLCLAGPGHLVQGAPPPPSTGDVYARLAGLESRTTELDGKLAGACALYLETVGSTEGAERAIKSFDAITLEAAGIKAALTELTDLLKKASAQVTVEGGGDFIEGRKKQKENLESKIATCDNLIRVSDGTTSKAAKLKTIFSEAVAFRKAVADLYGKSTADSETRAVAEKSVTAIVGSLVNRPPMLQPSNLSPGDEPKANSAASVVSTPSPVWILLGVLCLVLVLAAKRGKWGKSKGGAPPVPPSKAPIPPPTPPTPPTTAAPARARHAPRASTRT